MRHEALSESLEDYLETILRIVMQKRAARTTDIARQLAVRASSVTAALRNLAERGLINYAPYDVITLTAAGDKIARDIMRRHEVLRDFFVEILTIEPASAETAACRMEHALPRDIFRRLVQFGQFVQECPESGRSWRERFLKYCSRQDDRVPGAAADSQASAREVPCVGRPV